MAYNGQLAISVMDMQKCDSVQGFFLALGLVVENMQKITIQVDPSTFNVQDSHGEMINASDEYALKYPLNTLRSKSRRGGCGKPRFQAQ